MKNVRSSQPCILMNSVKHKFFHVRIVSLYFGARFCKSRILRKCACWENCLYFWSVCMFGRVGAPLKNYFFYMERYTHHWVLIIENKMLVVKLRRFFKTSPPLIITLLGATLHFFRSNQLKISASDIRDKVFKSGPSKIFWKQPLKSLKEYGLLQQTISPQIF